MRFIESVNKPHDERGGKIFYTKHYLKFGKIKPTILNICDFGAVFFLYFIGV